MEFGSTFDPCDQLIRQIVIRCGELLYEAKGRRHERNATKLYEETSKLLGLDIADTKEGQLPDSSTTEGPDGVVSAL